MMFVLIKKEKRKKMASYRTLCSSLGGAGVVEGKHWFCSPDVYTTLDNHLASKDKLVLT